MNKLTRENVDSGTLSMVNNSFNLYAKMIKRRSLSYHTIKNNAILNWSLMTDKQKSRLYKLANKNQNI